MCNQKKKLSFGLAATAALLLPLSAHAGSYPPRAGISGSTAVHKNDSRIVGWATSVVSGTPGPMAIDAPEYGDVDWGWPGGAAALGPADADTDSYPAVSLGDGGQLTLGFLNPIYDGPGFDFAVFENGIFESQLQAAFLELAFVEVSSNGTDFFRFPAISLTQTHTQVDSFDLIDPTDIHNLAGKYQRGYGTPFDLSELRGINPLLDVDAVRFVRVIDVIGSIDPEYGSRDSQGRLINDPWSTPFATGGFDLDAVAVLNQIPEPSLGALLLTGVGWFGARRRRR